MNRHPECVARWPECEPGGYDPRCCRFPKSCSCERAETLTPHDKIAGWLADSDGNIFTRVREFTCPNHPDGPPREEGDDYTAVEWITLCLLDELGTEAVKTVAPGVTREQIEEAREDLGVCCRGHRWRDTGELREVGAMEIFLRLNISGNIFGGSSILLNEINRSTPANWQGVRIPLILSAEAPPKQTRGYSLDPSKPPTVE